MKAPIVFQDKAESLHKLVTITIDIVIILSIVLNILIFFRSKVKISNNIIPKNKYSQVDNRLPPEPSPFPYTQQELDEAIKGLHLPTWSRSYVPCTSPKSEVTCPQIIEAWRTIKRWITYMDNTTIENREYIKINHVTNGVGNRISMDITMFLLSLMTNRTMVIQGNFVQQGHIVSQSGNAYKYRKHIYDMNNTFSQILSKRPQKEIDTFSGWYSSDFYSQGGKTLCLNLLIFSSMIYVQHQLSAFAYSHFGMHAIYFLSNFLIEIPNENLEYILKLFKTVPKNVRIFGIHLRFHMPGHYFTYGIQPNMKALVPFLLDKMNNKPTMFAFTSDSKDMEKEFLKVFGNYTILTDSVKRPDFDHASALVDILFMTATNECLGTFRSSFSFNAISKMCKRGYYIEKYSAQIFQMSNSQVGAISMQYHAWDRHDWQTSRRFVLAVQSEKCLRLFFNYFIL
ncbi:hypothetical protein GPJ56_002686 [Histomonas meleagridis]|uniref:uncharacterized protein n=1 Tax=Histomonas meleagridis TaxID=135588 RepID=UPI00355A96EB|nr:hypothetical protein GPJ56_002686 [Histomonas meleagridis]KAH0803024.1 hypothetical protein GO595_004117 [Histomonas meleagridis]